MAKLIIRSSPPFGGVKVASARTEKEARGLAVRYIKVGHRAIVKRGNYYTIYVV